MYSLTAAGFDLSISLALVPEPSALEFCIGLGTIEQRDCAVFGELHTLLGGTRSRLDSNGCYTREVFHCAFE
jgi:hypothetical protein